MINGLVSSCLPLGIIFVAASGGFTAAAGLASDLGFTLGGQSAGGRVCHVVCFPRQWGTEKGTGSQFCSPFSTKKN